MDAPPPFASAQAMSIAEACLFLGVGRDKLRALRRRRIDPLPCRDLGGVIRFRLDEVEAWIEGQSIRPATVAKPKRRTMAAATPHADRFLKGRG